MICPLEGFFNNQLSNEPMKLRKFCYPTFVLVGVVFSMTSGLILCSPVNAQDMSTSRSNSSVLQMLQQPQQSNFLISLFGVTNQTGNVFTFIKVNNITKGAQFNATARDENDGNVDGVVQAYMSIVNQTLANGTSYTACNLVLNTLQSTCVEQHVSPFIKTQFVELTVGEKNLSSCKSGLEISSHPFIS